MILILKRRPDDSSSDSDSDNQSEDDDSKNESGSDNSSESSKSTGKGKEEEKVEEKSREIEKEISIKLREEISPDESKKLIEGLVDRRGVEENVVFENDLKIVGDRLEYITTSEPKGFCKKDENKEKNGLQRVLAASICIESNKGSTYPQKRPYSGLQSCNQSGVNNHYSENPNQNTVSIPTTSNQLTNISKSIHITNDHQGKMNTPRSGANTNGYDLASYYQSGGTNIIKRDSNQNNTFAQYNNHHVYTNTNPNKSMSIPDFIAYQTDEPSEQRPNALANKVTSKIRKRDSDQKVYGKNNYGSSSYSSVDHECSNLLDELSPPDVYNIDHSTAMNLGTSSHHASPKLNYIPKHSFITGSVQGSGNNFSSSNNINNQHHNLNFNTQGQSFMKNYGQHNQQHIHQQPQQHLQQFSQSQLVSQSLNQLQSHQLTQSQSHKANNQPPEQSFQQNSQIISPIFPQNKFIKKQQNNLTNPSKSYLSQSHTFNSPLGMNVNANLNLNNSYFSSQNVSNKSSQNLQHYESGNNQTIDYSKYSQEDLLNNANKASKTQSGCNSLIQFINTIPNYADRLFLKIDLNEVLNLSIGKFGNFLIQSIIEKISEENKYKYFFYINNLIEVICNNQYGSRTIQKLIIHLSSDKLKEEFLKVIRPKLFSIIKDFHGYHVVLKLIKILQSPLNEEIYTQINEYIVDIACDKHGSLVIQGGLELATDIQKKVLERSLVYSIKGIINNKYGNYVIQYLLSSKDFELSKRIVISIIDDFLPLCKLKFSSNVIEKCCETCDDETLIIILKVIIKPNVVREMLFDNFANYVLQKALAVSKDPYRHFILKEIHPLLSILQSSGNSFGTKLYYILVENYPELGLGGGKLSQPGRK